MATFVPPTISSITGSETGGPSGAVGDVITISGTHLMGGDGSLVHPGSTTVTIGTVQAANSCGSPAFLSRTSSSLLIRVPSLALGVYDVTVRTELACVSTVIDFEATYDKGVVTSVAAFTVGLPIPPPDSPEITSLDPDRIEEFVATDVTITGTHFTPDCTVTIDVPDEPLLADNSFPATNVVVVSETEITATIPRMARGLTGQHTLTVASEIGSDTVVFTVFRRAMLRGASLVTRARAATPPAPTDTRAITARSTRASLVAPRLAPPPNRVPGDYDASATGRAVSKNHYFQGFDTAEIIRDSILVGHDGENSIISLAGFKNSTRKRSILAFERGMTPVLTQQLAHGGDPWSAFFVLRSPAQLDGDGQVLAFPNGDTAFATLSLAFDDTHIYSVHGYRLGVPNGVVDFSAVLDLMLFKPELVVPPTIAARNYTNPAVENHSWGAAAYARERDNGGKLAQIWGAEHDVATGNHRVPFARLNGFTEVFNAVVSAPGAVGDRTSFEVDASPTGRTYIAPALVPEAGSGKLQVRLAVKAGKVWVTIQRRTSGTTNSARLVVWAVSAT